MFRIFGCKCFILNNGKDKLHKFDTKVDEGIFLAYRLFNNRILVVGECLHVTFDETNPREMEKCSSGFHVLGVLTEYFINDDNPKVDPPKVRTLNMIKKKADKRVIEKISQQNCIKIGLSRKIIHWTTF